MRTLILLLFFFSLSNNFCFGQVQNETDSIEIMCDGKFFTLCEEPPVPKAGIKEYQKQINQKLKEKNYSYGSGKALILVIISKNGEVLDVSAKENNIDKIDALIDIIKTLNAEWKPAKQNGRFVCAYSRISIKVKAGELRIIE